MDIEKVEKIFEQELSLIKNEQIKSFAIHFLSIVKDDFWEIPATMTGKYHPTDCNKKHGLVLHTKLVCAYAKVLIDGMIERNNEYTNTCSIIISSCLLHDIAKEKRYKEYSQYNNHPLIASDLVKDEIENNIQHFSINSMISSRLIDCIKLHSGIFTPLDFGKPLEEYSHESLIVYLADFLASRRNQNHQMWIKKQYAKIVIAIGGEKINEEEEEEKEKENEAKKVD